MSFLPQVAQFTDNGHHTEASGTRAGRIGRGTLLLSLFMLLLLGPIVVWMGRSVWRDFQRDIPGTPEFKATISRHTGVRGAAQGRG